MKKLTKGFDMLTSLEQQVLKNAVEAIKSEDDSCLLAFSRFDKAQIMLIRRLFEIECEVQKNSPFNLNNNFNESERWSETVNSSKFKVSYLAQVKYVETYMQDLFPDLKKKKSPKM